MVVCNVKRVLRDDDPSVEGVWLLFFLSTSAKKAVLLPVQYCTKTEVVELGNCIVFSRTESKSLKKQFYRATQAQRYLFAIMPLKGIPDSITPELLFALAKMGHGDFLVIADANFPSDSVSANCVIKTPIRVHGLTSKILHDVLALMPIDQYVQFPVKVMDRVESDKQANLSVPAYSLIQDTAKVELEYVERFAFYELAKKAFVVIQSDDKSLYANCVVAKGVL